MAMLERFMARKSHQFMTEMLDANSSTTASSSLPEQLALANPMVTRSDTGTLQCLDTMLK